MPKYNTPQTLISRRGLPTDLSFSDGEVIDISAGDHTLVNGFATTLYVGVGGNVKLRLISDKDFTLVGVLAGTLLPFTFKKVYQTGTTATDLVAFW